MWKKAKMSTKKEPLDYWQLNHYEVMLVENKSKLIYHVKEDRILKEFSPKYKNIIRHDIELYIHIC